MKPFMSAVICLGACWLGVIFPVEVNAAAPAFVMQLGTHGTGPGEFYYPLGLAIGAGGDLYVTDSGDPMCSSCGGWRVQRFTRDGLFVSQWGSYGDQPGQFKFPDGIATDVAGHVYVSDGGANRIQKFAPDGQLLAAWGSYGAASGQFNNQRGVAVDAAGNVFIADTGNNRIQKFASDGSFVLKWGAMGVGPGTFISPWAVALDSNDNVYVVDAGGRLQKFTGEGGYLAEWQGVSGPFSAACGVAIAPDGSVYVADTGRCLIQKFTASGEFTILWGAPGVGPGQFSSGPRGIAVDAQGRVYAVDSGNDRVQVFGEQATAARKSTWGRLKGLYR